MKELTIEEKAKRYNKALENARQEYNTTENVERKQWLEELFPELTELKDEKIRKAIYGWIYTRPSQFFDNGFSKEEMLAWLEKQQKPIINVPPREVILAIWDLGNEWKELTNGSISTEHGTQLDYIQKHWHESEYYLQKKQGEQKFIDKNEIKFNEGDWIIYKNDICQIVKLEEGCNKLVTNFGIEKEPVNERNLSTARLWDICDAKDSDILAYKDEISIYKHDIKNCTKEGTNFGGFVYYCSYDGKRFITDSLYSLTEKDKKDIYPATKEQRDLLFTKMKEAGYEWYASKKKLTKVDKKTIDNIKPTPKVGDWIIFNEHHSSIFQITSINKRYYYLRNYLGDLMVLPFDSELIRLWNIEDAEDGDVLYSPTHRLIWIYKDEYEYHAAVNFDYADHMSFNGVIVIPSDVCPANKVQRNILFQKIKECGYYWTDNKKELNTINGE